MAMLSPSYGTGPVALLAEGVDRNSEVVPFRSGKIPSPSSRRAWIEILVAPFFGAVLVCRPPRGGRG